MEQTDIISNNEQNTEKTLDPTLDATKEIALNKYVNSIKYLPAPNGKCVIRPYIGGSEMHKALYSPKTLLDSKSGKHTFEGNIHTNWGNMFENISKTVLENMFNCHIHEVQSIPGMLNDEGKVMQVYTPDGLTVISTELLNKIGINNISNTDYLTILIEIKSPSKRLLKTDWDSIIMGYKTQVLTGLCTIPIVDIGLYFDAIYRVCKLDSFADNTFVPFANQLDKYDHLPISYGLIGIYNKEYNKEELETSLLFDRSYTDTNQKTLRKKLVEFYLSILNYANDNNLCSIVHDTFTKRMNVINTNDTVNYSYLLDNIMDLSNSDECTLSEILRSLTDKKLSFIELYGNKTPIEYISEFKQYCSTNNIKPIAILPWKLFKYNLWPVYRDINFLENNREKITNVFNQIMELVNT